MAALTLALHDWNSAATPVMADMNDPSLDVENFGNRTKGGRDEMRASLAKMKAGLPSLTDLALDQVLRDIVGSYDDKMTAIDALAVAVKVSDYDLSTLPLDSGSMPSTAKAGRVPKTHRSGRPFLSVDDVNACELAMEVFG